MFERILRLIAVGGMFVTLFLHDKPLGAEDLPNWVYIFWFSSEALPAVFGSIKVGDRIFWLSLVLPLLAIPLLILFNICLLIHPFRIIKIFYTVLIILLLPLTWYRSFSIGFEWPDAGVYWVSTAAVSVAALMEIVLVVRERVIEQ